MSNAHFWPDGRTRKPANPTIIYVENITERPEFDAWRSDPNTKILYREGVTGVTLKEGKNSTHIIDMLAVWGLTPSGDSIYLLDKLMQVCGVGTHAYPSRLGLEMMRAAYPEDEPLLPVPQGDIWQALHDNMVGGRVDTLRSGETFPLAYETDMNSAYVWGMLQTPKGYPMRIYGEPKRSPSYSLYKWRIPQNLSLGPLPIRLPNNIVCYPMYGEDEGWYWDIEAAQAQAQGVEMEAKNGFTWDGGLADTFEPWARRMWALRQDHPELADLFKLVSVAAIGALGATGEHAEIVRLDEYPDCEPVHSPQWGFSDTYGVRRTQAAPGGLLQVSSYVRARVRCRLYAAALPYAQTGDLISTDYDAIRTTRAGFEMPGLGGWKTKQLHNVTVPNPRWLVSDEKIRTPGLSRA